MSVSWTLISQPITIVGVFVLPDTDTGSAEFAFDGSDTDLTNRIWFQTSTTVANQYGLVAGTALNGGGITELVWARFFGVANGVSSSFDINGVNEASGDAGTEGLAGFTVMSNTESGTSFGNRKAAEFVIYDKELSSSEKTQLMNYLENKWFGTVSCVNPPDSITDLSLVSVTKTTADVSFSAPDLNGETLINYMLNVTTPQQDTPPSTFWMNTTSTTPTITGLTLDTEYSASASAYTAGGGNWTLANVLNFTTLAFIPPDAPTLDVTSLSDSSARFTMTNGSSSGDFPVKDFAIRCEENNAGGWFDVVSNNTVTLPRQYENSSFTSQATLVCQARDGSSAGWSDWSSNATATLILEVLQGQRQAGQNPDDHLLKFINFIAGQGGVWFGLGAIPFAIMLIGFMAGKKTVRIFTMATLALMGITHASGYFVYPDWYWSLSLLFGIGLVLGRQKSD